MIAGVLLTSLDYERQLYSRSRDIGLVTAAGSTTNPQHLKDNNVVRLGGELRVRPSLPVRLGVGFFDDYHDKAYVNAGGGGAPAPAYLITVGGGWAIARTVDLDFSYTLMLNSGTLDADGLAPTGVPASAA